MVQITLTYPFTDNDKKFIRRMLRDEAIQDDTTPEPGKRYVYGLKGIQELFNVSHGTAQRYKDGIIKDAVFQSGRKIVVDADKAMELFNTYYRRGVALGIEQLSKKTETDI